MNARELLEKDMFQRLDLEDSSPEIKAKMLESASSTVDNRVAIRVADLLPEKQFQRFRSATIKGEPDVMKAVLVQNGIDLNALIAQEVDRFINEMAEQAKALENPPDSAHTSPPVVAKRSATGCGSILTLFVLLMVLIVLANSP